MLRSRVCRILLAVLADVYLSNFMLWISKRKALVVPPDKVFPSLIAFHTKKKKNPPSYNYPQLFVGITLFIWTEILGFVLSGNFVSFVSFQTLLCVKHTLPSSFLSVGLPFQTPRCRLCSLCGVLV